MKKYEGLERDIAEEIIERIDEFEGSYGADLVYDMYNQDYYIIGTYKAKEFVKENIDEVFQALEDYQFQIGEYYRDIADYEKLASLTALFIAQEILNKTETIDEYWNEEITEEGIEKIKNEIQDML